MAVKTWGSVKPGNANEKQPKLDELIKVHKYQDGKWETHRLVGPVYSYVFYWIKIRYKAKDTEEWKTTDIPKMSTSYNGLTEEFDENIYDPWHKAFTSGKYGENIREQKYYYGNSIFRKLQENEPKKKPKHLKSELKEKKLLGYPCHIMEQDSRSWSPIEALRVTPGLARKLRDLTELNEYTDKKTKEKGTKDLSDPKYGCDVKIRYNSKAAASAAYEVQLGSRTPLTEDEKAYLLQQLDILKPPTEASTKKDWADLKSKIVGASKSDDSDDDEDDEDAPKTSKKNKKDKVKTNKSKKTDDDDDLDLDDDIDDDLDLDEDDEKPKKKTSKVKTKTKPSSKSNSKVKTKTSVKDKVRKKKR